MKAYNLIWFEHLVGDIDEPLHGSVRYNEGGGDTGGNHVKIKMPVAMGEKCKCPPSKSTLRELHAFSKDLPGSCPADAALTPALAFAKKLPMLLTNPNSRGTDNVSDTDPMNWASDSLALAEKDAYAASIGEGLQSEDGTNGFVVSQGYYDQAMTDEKSQIALAGRGSRNC